MKTLKQVFTDLTDEFIRTDFHEVTFPCNCMNSHFLTIAWTLLYGYTRTYTSFISRNSFLEKYHENHSIMFQYWFVGDHVAIISRPINLFCYQNWWILTIAFSMHLQNRFETEWNKLSKNSRNSMQVCW